MDAVNILVVEDESIVAMDIRNCLVNLGFSVIGCVPSGEEAIAIVAQNPPDLVLMDIRLQGEMNGIDTARRIMDLYEVPSLFLTSYVDREILAQAMGLNAVGYVLKPFEERELGVAVEMALHRRQVEVRLRQALQQATAGKVLAVAPVADPGLPELQIRTLGQMEFLLGDRVVARAEDLSRSLRNLLGLVLTSPQMRISKDEILLALWPESPPEKARSNFDSLLLRLRKTMDTMLQPHSITQYLVLQRGILCLNNCRVDVVEFQLAARRGLEWVKKGNTAAAAESFAEALRLWDGPFLPGMPDVERLHEFKEKLDRLYVDAVLAWSELLQAAGEHEAASRILAQALLHDRANDDLVRALHQSYLAAHNPTRAAEVVKQYAEALRRAGFRPSEICEILESFKNRD
jgi:two-component SAPR family response regulator